MFTAFDDTPLDNIVWMPAHQGKGAAAIKAKSDDTPLTLVDIETNDMADRLAKRGVEDHRVPYRVRQEWQRCLKTATERAKWTARATREANNLPNFPYSDSESSRKAAEEARKRKLWDKADGTIQPKAPARKIAVVARPPTLGDMRW